MIKRKCCSQTHRNKYALLSLSQQCVSQTTEISAIHRLQSVINIFPYKHAAICQHTSKLLMLLHAFRTFVFSTSGVLSIRGACSPLQHIVPTRYCGQSFCFCFITNLHVLSIYSRPQILFSSKITTKLSDKKRVYSHNMVGAQNLQGAHVTR